MRLESVPRWAWWAAGAAAALVLLKSLPMPVTLEQLRAILPALTPARALELYPHLATLLREAGATTPTRAAALIAQVAHESGSFRYVEELASGDAYEGRKDLGNTQPGDGRRYKGRGWIQLTGRANYRAAGAALGLPLEQEPQRAAELHTAARVAAWYWRTRGLNELADAGRFTEITRRINGGQNGAEDRARYHAQALAALATPTTKGAA